MSTFATKVCSFGVFGTTLHANALSRRNFSVQIYSFVNISRYTQQNYKAKYLKCLAALRKTIGDNIGFIFPVMFDHT